MRSVQNKALSPRGRRLLLSVLLALVLTACNTLSMESFNLEHLKPNLERPQYTESFDRQYSHYLAQGYLQLAEYEEYITGDEEASLHFREKYRRAQKYSSVTPDEPSRENLSEELREEMSQGQSMLQDAVEILDMTENAVRLAEAQVNYDCWLERVAERDENDRDEFCRTRFYSALKTLEQPVSHHASVYFNSNETSLNDPAKTAIQNITDQFPQRDFWRVLLTGRTDKNGNYTDNVVLSMRRAVAVRNALAQHGIDPEQIVIEAVGESQTTAGGSGYNNQNLRRVDMTIVPVYLGYEHKGIDIKEAFPHFFGSDDPDM